MTPGYILIIDDDPDIQIALGEFLGDEGYKTKGAVNGAEALKLLNSANELPRVILLDLMMPVCDGFQFREEQMKSSKLAAIPTVLLSADGSLKEKAIRLGIDDVLQKPIGLVALFSMMKKVY